jgi:hypothetical protein
MQFIIMCLVLVRVFYSKKQWPSHGREDILPQSLDWSPFPTLKIWNWSWWLWWVSFAGIKEILLLGTFNDIYTFSKHLFQSIILLFHFIKLLILSLNNSIFIKKKSFTNINYQSPGLLSIIYYYHNYWLHSLPDITYYQLLTLCVFHIKSSL